MTALEKLARRICWLGFGGTSPKVLGTTEAQYWRALSDSKRTEYLDEASRHMWLRYHENRSASTKALVSEAYRTTTGAMGK